MGEEHPRRGDLGTTERGVCIFIDCGPAAWAQHPHPSQPGLHSQHRACTLSTGPARSAHDSHRPSDLGEKPNRVWGGKPCHTEGHSDRWPAHQFVLIQPILKKYIWREKISCLFWSFLHLWNKDSLACCVAGVHLDSKDAEVARGRWSPSPTHGTFWRREEGDVLWGGSTPNTNRCLKRVTSPRRKVRGLR